MEQATPSQKGGVRLDFTIPGRPVGKQRARTVFGARGVRTYTPDETVRWENAVKVFAQQAGVEMDLGPVRVDILVTRTIPKSWSKRQTQQAKDGVYAVGKPDIDNVVKSTLDGLNGVAYKDDSQVVKVSAMRTFGDVDATHVTLISLQD
jgi:Holliday junction resolvase RusA-like endonuclease